MDKLEERLRAHNVIRYGEPVTIVIDGKEVTANTGDVVQLRNPDGPEAADEITRLKGEVERLSAEVTAWGHIASGLEAYLQDRQHEGDHITPAMVLSILHGDIRIREQMSRQIYAATQARVQSAESALAAKQALIDELVDGLEPFAREADDWPDKMDCEDIPADATDIKIEDLRRARSLISKARSSGKAGSDA